MKTLCRLFLAVLACALVCSPDAFSQIKRDSSAPRSSSSASGGYHAPQQQGTAPNSSGVLRQNFDESARDIIERYNHQPTPEMMGKMDAAAKRACERQGGFVVDAYNRSICNFKTRDANAPCGPTQECQGMCLAIVDENASQGIEMKPTNNSRYPGRCSMYSHPIGCAILQSGEKWCTADSGRDVTQREAFIVASEEERLRTAINAVLDNLDDDLYQFTSRRLGANTCSKSDNIFMCSRSQAFECLKRGNTTLLQSKQGYACVEATKDAGKSCALSESCEGECVLTRTLSTEELVQFWEKGSSIGECSATKKVFGCISRLERQGGVPRVQRVCYD